MDPLLDEVEEEEEEEEEELLEVSDPPVPPADPPPPSGVEDPQARRVSAAMERLAGRAARGRDMARP